MALKDLEQQLLYDLTCAGRSIQILHWNLLGITFPNLHPYLGDIYEQLNGYVDITAEQIKFLGGTPDGDLVKSCELSNVEVIPSKSYKEKQAINKALNIITTIKSSVDDVNEEATSLNNYAVIDTFGAISAELDKVIYFLSHADSKEMGKSKAKFESVMKVYEDEQLVFGYASVCRLPNGERAFDWQDDIYEMEDMEQAVYDYVEKSREINENHQGKSIGTIVESIVLTKEKMQSMGIPEGILPTGVWIGIRIHDKEIFQKVKNKEYKAFSIEGSAIREEV